jgi:hypothetical protein
MMRGLILYGVLICGVALAACDRSESDTTTPTTPTPAMNTFTGTWHSTSTTSTTGGCSSTNWTISPTGATTATIAYTATCSGVAVAGTGNATLNGNTLTWATNGTAANNCAFGLSGTAVPDTAADLRVAYSGTVCGRPVSGTETLRR